MMRTLVRSCCALLSALTLTLIFASSQNAAAATFTVNSLNDSNDASPGNGTCVDFSGDCTLRAAMQEAEAFAGADTINFSVTGTINLGLGNLSATTPMNINGPGSSQLTVRRNVGGEYRIFFFNVATISLSGMTITNGSVPAGGGAGGGIANAANLTLTDVVITGNRAGNGFPGAPDGGTGGGINSQTGSLMMTNCVVSNNSSGNGAVTSTGTGGNGGNGGGVNLSSGSLTMTNCVIDGNMAGEGGDSSTSLTASAPAGGNGGGLYIAGTANLNGVTVSNNRSGLGGTSSPGVTGGQGGSGAGIHIFMGSLTLTGSTVTGNIAGNGGAGGIGAPGGFGGNGGGIAAFSTQVTIDRSTFDHNAAGNGGTGSIGAAGGNGGYGGGLYNDSATLATTNSTISSNTAGNGGPGGEDGNGGAGGNGGGVANFSTIQMTLDTVTQNTAGAQGGGIINGAAGRGGGLYNGGTFQIKSTIVAVNNGAAGGPERDISGTSYTSSGYNLIGVADGATGFGATGDQLGTSGSPLNPQLAPLANNGGPTRTHALLSGSPAIDKGNAVTISGATATTDQRGKTRPADFTSVTNASDASDIGAFELQAAAAGEVIISEFRFSGSNTQDEFVELYNNTDASITVSTTDGSSGWSLVSNDNGTTTVRATITNNTVIPARGHYLFASSPFIGGYQLTGYAVPDQAMIPPDIAAGGGVALFSTSNTNNFTLANRLDAVGFAGMTDTLYKEGAGLAPSGGIGANLAEHSFVRDLSSGKPKDTNNNAADFLLVSTTGAVLGGVQSRLGAPGPENRSSPIERNAQFPLTSPAPCTGSSQPPNRVRDFNSVPNGSQGTLKIRRTVTNNTGASVTQLRFRIITLTTFPVPSGTADLRVLSSSADTFSNPCPGGPTASEGLTLEQPPTQGNGGGINSSLRLVSVTTAPSTGGSDETSAAGGDETVTVGAPTDSDTIKLNAPLANGASVTVNFLLGVQQPGAFRFYVNVEALP